MTRTIAFGAVALLAVACGDKDTADTEDTDDTVLDDTGDTETGLECTSFDGAPYLGLSADYCTAPEDASDFGFGCDDATDPHIWFFNFYTVGVTGGGELAITQTGSDSPWNETHPMDSFDSGDDWDNLYIELTDVDDPQQVVEGTSTLYECNEARWDTLTWALTVFDADGADASCAAWGHDVSSTDCDEYSWE